jgi:hypothetical protein
MTISYVPEVWDVRSDDAGSLDVLPKLGEGEFQKLYDFMQGRWPEFDVLGTYGESRAQAGQRWWAIGAIEVKEGPALFQPQFRKDRDTYDDGNVLVLFHWDGAPEDVSELDVHYYDTAVYAFSEGAGSKGFPYGSESGPYAIWLNSDPADWVDRRVGSDAIVGLHWFDNHVSLNPVFWPMRKGGEVPPTPTDNYIAVVVNGEEVWRGNFRIIVEGVPTQ